jgi:hypothetical protein
MCGDLRCRFRIVLFLKRFYGSVEHPIDVFPIALNDSIEISVNWSVTGVDPIDIDIEICFDRSEPVERRIERADRVFDSVIKPGVEDDWTERFNSHVA